MSGQCNIDGKYKILVKKELLPQFLEQTYSCLIPEIWDELDKGDESYWCITFCYQKKKDEGFGTIMKKKVRNLTLDEIERMCRKMPECETETKRCPFFENDGCPLFTEEVLEKEVEIDE